MGKATYSEKLSPRLDETVDQVAYAQESSNLHVPVSQ